MCERNDTQKGQTDHREDRGVSYDALGVFLFFHNLPWPIAARTRPGKAPDDLPAEPIHPISMVNARFMPRMRIQRFQSVSGTVGQQPGNYVKSADSSAALTQLPKRGRNRPFGSLHQQFWPVPGRKDWSMRTAPRYVVPASRCAFQSAIHFCRYGSMLSPGLMV